MTKFSDIYKKNTPNAINAINEHLESLEDIYETYSLISLDEAKISYVDVSEAKVGEVIQGTSTLYKRFFKSADQVFQESDDKHVLGNSKFEVVSENEYNKASAKFVLPYLALVKKSASLYGGKFTFHSIKDIGKSGKMSRNSPLSEAYCKEVGLDYNELIKFGNKKSGSVYVVECDKFEKLVEELDMKLPKEDFLLVSVYLKDLTNNNYYRLLYNKKHETTKFANQFFSAVTNDAEDANADGSVSKVVDKTEDRELAQMLGLWYNADDAYKKLEQTKDEKVAREIASKALKSSVGFDKDEKFAASIEKFNNMLPSLDLKTLKSLIKLGISATKFRKEILRTKFGFKNHCNILYTSLGGYDGIKAQLASRLGLTGSSSKEMTADIILTDVTSDEAAKYISKLDYDLIPIPEEGYVVVKDEDGEEKAKLVFVSFKSDSKSALGRAAKKYKDKTKVSDKLEKETSELMKESDIFSYEYLIQENIFDKLTDVAKKVISKVKDFGKSFYEKVLELKEKLKKFSKSFVSFMNRDINMKFKDFVNELTALNDTGLDEAKQTGIGDTIEKYLNSNLNEKQTGIKEGRGAVVVKHRNIIRDRLKNEISALKSEVADKKYVKVAIELANGGEPAEDEWFDYTMSVFYLCFMRAAVSSYGEFISSKLGDVAEVIKNVVELYVEALFGKSGDIPMWILYASGKEYKYLGTKKSVETKTSSILDKVKEKMPITMISATVDGWSYSDSKFFVLTDVIEEIKPEYIRVRYKAVIKKEGTYSLDMETFPTSESDEAEIAQFLV